jgi:hypothetical protein
VSASENPDLADSLLVHWDNAPPIRVVPERLFLGHVPVGTPVTQQFEIQTAMSTLSSAPHVEIKHVEGSEPRIAVHNAAQGRWNVSLSTTPERAGVFELLLEIGADGADAITIPVSGVAF